MALLLPPLAGRQIAARAARPRARARARRGAPRRTSSARSMRTLTWMPREPEVFGQPTRPRVVERLAHDARDLADLRPLDAGHRIEIDAQLVGVLEVVGAHRVRVQLEARRGSPSRRAPPRRAARPPRRCGPTGSAASTTSIHGGRDCGRALLEEELAVDRRRRSARATFGRPPGAAQRAVGDRQVVLHEVELGDRRPRESRPSRDSRPSPRVRRRRRRQGRAWRSPSLKHKTARQPAARRPAPGPR